jgi:uncharacterized protein
MFAARVRDMGIVRLLAEAGASVRHTAFDGSSCLSVAMVEEEQPLQWDSCTRIVRELLAIDSRNGKQAAVKCILAESGDTLLHVAAKFGQKQVLISLVQAGLEIDATNKEGRTALMHAATAGFPSVIRSAVDAGAQANAQDKSGQTALHIAAALGLSICATVLIQCGATVDARDNIGRTPLVR